jgi:hypothetical protein
MMLRFIRVALATLAAAVGVGLFQRWLDLQGLAWGLGDVGFLLVAMFLASLSDRELFWAVPPKKNRH